MSVRRQEVETLEYNRDKGMGVTVLYLGQRREYASSSDFSLTAIHATVDAALAIARFTAEDNCAGLPDLSYLPKSRWNLSCFIRGIFQLPTQSLWRSVASRQRLMSSPLIKNSEGANVSAQQSHFVSANSLGFMAGFATSRHSVSCSVIVKAVRTCSVTIGM